MKKQIIFSLLLICSLFAVQPQTSATNVKQVTTTVVDNDNEGDEVVAYSDSITNDSIAQAEDEDYENQFERRMERKMMNVIEGLATPGIVVAVIFAIILCLLVFLAPLIIVILLIRYFIKRNNARVRLAEKAIETGQSMPEDLKPIERQSSEFLHERGVKNITIGLGLFVMFLIWRSSTFFLGVSALVAIYGVGQLYLSRTSINRYDDIDRDTKNKDIDPDDVEK